MAAVLAMASPLFAPASLGQAPPSLHMGDSPAVDVHRADLAARRRVYKRFDFEESAELPHEMPPGFYRYAGASSGEGDGAALAQGFPLFGRMRPVNDAAWSGDWSFGFDLEGGSMAARIPTAVIPVIPLNDYVVTTMVRTEDLRYAGVRLSAWLADEHGEAVPGSRQTSAVVRTEGAWQQLAVELPGDFEDAADLLLELELLQPREAAARSSQPRLPLLEDVSGRAWFDDVTIWHVPRLALRSSSGSNVIETPDRITLDVAVRDVTDAELTAVLRVIDLDGVEVFHERFPAPRGRRARQIAIPVERAGWYRATLEVLDNEQLVGQRWLDVALIAREPRGSKSGHAFGVVLDGATSPSAWPVLIRGLNSSHAVVPIWPREAGVAHYREELPGAIEALLGHRVDLVFALESIPADLAQEQGLDRSQVLELLARPGSVWREELSPVLAAFGLEVDQWQFGASGEDGLPWQSNFDELVSRARDSLASVVPLPRVFVPWPAEYEPGRAHDGLHLSLPGHIPAESVSSLVGGWSEETVAPLITFERAANAYTARRRLADLAVKALKAWRAGAPRLAIHQPWRVVTHAASPIPDPEYVLWRQLGVALAGRRFAGELRLGQGLHAWVLAGDGRAEPAIIAWAEETVSDPWLRAELGPGSIVAVDAFGNERHVDTLDGRHVVQLDTLPTLIRGIDIELARLRVSVHLDRPFVDTLLRPAEHSLRLTNPWPVTITGRATLTAPTGIHISPRTLEFSVAADDRIDLPVTLKFDRNLVADDYHVDVVLEVDADRSYRLSTTTPLRIGWDDLRVTAQWRRAVNAQTGAVDLVITQTVTNVGDASLHLLDCFVRAPGTRQQRRSIANISPGETIVRTFRIDDGATQLADRTLRLGVAQRDGPHRLNLAMKIPAFLAASSPLAAGGDDTGN